jgi:hypothetical protein
VQTGIEQNRNVIVNGNTRQPAKSEQNLSEAARHQAMPQAALFSPKQNYGGRNGNGGGNRSR